MKDKKYRILMIAPNMTTAVYWQRFATVKHAETVIFEYLCDLGAYADYSFTVIKIVTDEIESRKTERV
jgi:hypothetical protein